MTVTVKFPVALESDLRRFAATTGVATSAVIRDAVLQYLLQAPKNSPGSYGLGSDLFGRYSGPESLATERKADVADAWDDKQNKQRLAADLRLDRAAAKLKRDAKRKAKRDAK